MDYDEQSFEPPSIQPIALELLRKTECFLELLNTASREIIHVPSQADNRNMSRSLLQRAKARVILLVDAPHPGRVADAVQKLADPTLREHMGAGGKSWVMDKYSSKTLGKILRGVVYGPD